MSAAGDTEYLTALGQAVFSYALLEYRVIWILETLSPGYINNYRASFRSAAAKLARDLKDQSESIAETKPQLAGKLASLHSDFVKLGRRAMTRCTPIRHHRRREIDTIRQHFNRTSYGTSKPSVRLPRRLVHLKHSEPAFSTKLDKISASDAKRSPRMSATARTYGP